MKIENNGKSRMWKDAPAALCEFAGVDPARKWAQCKKERDEWAALAGQYKQERDDLSNYLDAAHYATCNAELRKKRNEALIELQKMREEIERKSEIIQELVEARDMALDEIESLMARNAQWATIARRAMVELDKARRER